jgi:hypothetical protein
MMPGSCFGDRHIRPKAHHARLSTSNVEQSIDFGMPAIEGLLTVLIEDVECDLRSVKIHESSAWRGLLRTRGEDLHECHQRASRLGNGIMINDDSP